MPMTLNSHPQLWPLTSAFQSLQVSFPSHRTQNCKPRSNDLSHRTGSIPKNPFSGSDSSALPGSSVKYIGLIIQDSQGFMPLLQSSYRSPFSHWSSSSGFLLHGCAMQFSASRPCMCSFLFWSIFPMSSYPSKCKPAIKSCISNPYQSRISVKFYFLFSSSLFLRFFFLIPV